MRFLLFSSRMNNNETAILQSSMINLDRVYPVGSIYFSVSAISPNELFGGVWEQIKDCFLLACGNKFTNGTTGGSEKETLTISQIPAHSHSGSTSSDGNHKHGICSGYGDITNTGGDAFRYQQWANSNRGWHNFLIGDSGNHTHSISTNTVGGGESHNNMPPYLSVFVWKRVG